MDSIYVPLPPSGMNFATHLSMLASVVQEEGDKAENQVIYQEHGVTIRSLAAIGIADLVMHRCFLTLELMVKYSGQSPMEKEKNYEYT